MSRWMIPCGVRGIQRVGDFDGEVEQLARVESGLPAMRCFSVAPSRNSMAMKGWPSCFADVVDGADVGMIQSRGSARFALETLERLGVARQLVGQELQGDKAAEPRVFGLVNHAHPAAAQLLHNAVVRDGLPNHSQ